MTRYSIYITIIFFALTACSNRIAEKNMFANSAKTHLQDTTFIDGNFVLFLRPDSARFESCTKEGEEIYEADSDFGFAISATIDSISRNEKYKNIRTTISVNRFIVIKDCQSCPLTVDRDTINYGIILSAKNKEIKIITFLHSGDYLYAIDEYFDNKRIDK